jgi:apolipoprotein N-acyltransferase
MASSNSGIRPLSWPVLVALVGIAAGMYAIAFGLHPVQFMNDGKPAAERKVWNSPWGKIGLAVCYDVSYARVMDDFVCQGARVLIVPTMDLAGWGEYQRRQLHGRMAPVGSAEYSIPVFGVWSSGVSQLTDRRGAVIVTAGYPGQGEMLAGSFDLAVAGHVPYDRPFAWCATGITAATIVYLTFAGLRLRSGIPPSLFPTAPVPSPGTPGEG